MNGEEQVSLPERHKMTLWSRSISAFEGTASVDREYFLQGSYVNALAEQKRAAEVAFGKALVTLFVLTALGLTLVGGYEVDIHIFGLELADYPFLVHLAAGVIGYMTFGFVLALIEQLMLEDMFRAVFRQLGIKVHQRFYTVLLGSKNVWIDMMEVQFDGLRNERDSILVVAISALVFVIVVVFVPILSGLFFVQYLSALLFQPWDGWVFPIVGLFGCAMYVAAIFFLIVLRFWKFNFTWVEPVTSQAEDIETEDLGSRDPK